MFNTGSLHILILVLLSKTTVFDNKCIYSIFDMYKNSMLFVVLCGLTRLFQRFWLNSSHKVTETVHTKRANNKHMFHGIYRRCASWMLSDRAHWYTLLIIWYNIPTAAWTLNPIGYHATVAMRRVFFLNHRFPRALILMSQWGYMSSMNWVVVASDNSLPMLVRRQAIAWINIAHISIVLLRTNFTEI